MRRGFCERFICVILGKRCLLEEFKMLNEFLHVEENGKLKSCTGRDKNSGPITELGFAAYTLI